jgi:hypothetical protein
MLTVPKQMNYAVVILVFVVLFAVGYWFVSGRYYYEGPRTRAHIVDGMVISDSSERVLADPEKSAAPPPPGPIAVIPVAMTPITIGERNEQ